MSSYLNFYLVPKKKKESDKDPEPMLLYSCNRAGNLYQAFYENMNIQWAGSEMKYTELTPSDMQSIVDSIKEDVDKAKKRLDSKVNAYRTLTNLSKEIVEEYVEEFASMSEYISDLESTFNKANVINAVVSDLNYSVFEKILINLD